MTILACLCFSELLLFARPKDNSCTLSTGQGYVALWVVRDVEGCQALQKKGDGEGGGAVRWEGNIMGYVIW